MKTATSLFDLISRWFFEPVSQRGMALCRIFFGAILFASYVGHFKSVPLFFGASGFAGKDFLAMTNGEGPALSVGLGRMLALYGGDGVVWSLYALLLLSALCFTVGYQTRIAGLTCWILHLTFNQRNYFADWGWATMMCAFLLYVALSDAGKVFSVDAVRAKNPPEPDLGSAWPLRLLQVHVCAMYLVAGWSRFDNPSWYSGDAIFLALVHEQYSRFNSPALDAWALRETLRPFGIFAMLLEPLAFLLWFGGTGALLACALIVMHVLLEFTTHVGWWNFMMIGALMTFLPPRWFRRA